MTCHSASLSLPLCQVRTELQTTSSKKRLLVHRPPGISVSSRRILYALQLSMQAFAYFASSWIHWAKASAKAALSVSAAGSSGRKLRPQALWKWMVAVPEGKHCAKTWCKGRKQRTKLQRKCLTYKNFNTLCSDLSAGRFLKPVVFLVHKAARPL